MTRLYCLECSEYLEGGDGECHDCLCGWKQPVDTYEYEMSGEVRILEQQLDVAREFCRQYQLENKQLRESTADCYEKNLDLNLENFELKNQNTHLQFLLDSVMLEYCPDEMTEDQMETWKNAQRVVDTADPNYYKSDTYKNNIKFSVDMIK